MFSTGHQDLERLHKVAEGTEWDPIVIEGTSIDFDRLLAVLNPMSRRCDWLPGDPLPYQGGVDEYPQVIDQIKELAMKHLEAMNLPPIEKFKLGVEYCVPGWYGDALSQLVSENLFDKDREFWEIDKIFNADWETAALALWVRGRAMQSLFEQEEMVRTRGVTAATTFVADRATRELENLA
ncbi:hypothetical protein CC1G_11810 [Coprinopsis cinerea okayama7|uniref:Uncharacterized protein n=1 Tax=Coprinopsis cinerea (strain Okayama-7 / 130 / ATCC MYA-4618 / FGSC 9003) TaxID=240176 RepID=A8N817_COPC7|nr:hypothetical protein CC1G_11810 [Coprinopsis cinerea okayama7\|eukprot:XP_001830973.2 hypothetical protein CC1G_11810 [Coprinopsis cinerea okayama7\